MYPEAGRQKLAILSTPGNGDIPLYWHTGTELTTVVAGAWIAVSGSAHGERRVSGVRRAAPLWWFLPDERVSAPSIERCQLQRASRATSERQKRNGDIPQFPAQRANGVRPLPRCGMLPRHLMRSDPICQELGNVPISFLKRARPARSRRLQSTPPPPQPCRSVPVC